MTLPKGFGNYYGYDRDNKRGVSADGVRRYPERPPKPLKEIQKKIKSGRCEECGHTKHNHERKFLLEIGQCKICMCPKYKELYTIRRIRK